jgi:hypothetical protein
MFINVSKKMLESLFALIILFGATLLVQQAWKFVGQQMDDKVSNQSNDRNVRPTLAFISYPTKKHCKATSAVIYTAPDGILIDWASSQWCMLLSLNLFKIICSYVGGLDASIDFVLAPIHLLFKFVIGLLLEVLLFVLLHLPAALKSWKGDSTDTLFKLAADLDEIYRHKHSWNWMSNCSPESGLQDPTEQG